MKLLAIDYSTQSTGFALFEDGKLIEYGALRLGTKKEFKGYPFGTLRKLEKMALLTKEMVDNLKPDIIVIEEINRGIGRIQQKILDGSHFILLRALTDFEGKLTYLDTSSWRKTLGIRLSDKDKFFNKNARSAGKRDLLIDYKVLAERFVNKELKMNFNVRENPSDNDIVDAISLGLAFLKK